MLRPVKKGDILKEDDHCSNLFYYWRADYDFGRGEAMKEKPKPENLTRRDVLLAIGGIAAIYFTQKGIAQPSQGGKK